MKTCLHRKMYTQFICYVTDKDSRFYFPFPFFISDRHVTRSRTTIVHVFVARTGKFNTNFRSLREKQRWRSDQVSRNEVNTTERNMYARVQLTDITTVLTYPITIFD